jgi:WD40 repeat protein
MGWEWQSVGDSDFTKTFNVLAFAPSGQWLAAAGIDEIRILDVRNGTTLRTIEGPPEILGLAFSPDGATLAGCGISNQIILWDIKSGLKKATFSHGRDVGYRVAFSPDGKHLTALGLAIADGKIASWRVQTWNVSTGKTVAQINSKDQEAFEYCRLSRDGRILAVLQKQRLNLLDTTNGQMKAAVEGPSPTSKKFGFAFSGDGRAIVTVSYLTKNDTVEGQLDWWAVENGKKLASKKLTEFIGAALVVSPTHDTIAFRRGDGVVRLWRTTDLLPSLNK